MSRHQNKPFTVKVTELLVPDSDVLENFCNENEKDRPHFWKPEPARTRGQ